MLLRFVAVLLSFSIVLKVTVGFVKNVSGRERKNNRAGIKMFGQV